MTFTPFSHGIFQCRPDGEHAALSIEDWEGVHDKPMTLLTSKELRNIASRLGSVADEMDLAGMVSEENDLNAEIAGTNGKVRVRKRGK